MPLPMLPSPPWPCLCARMQALAVPGSLPCFTRWLNQLECVLGGMHPGAGGRSAPRGLFPFEFDHLLRTWCASNSSSSSRSSDSSSGCRGGSALMPGEHNVLQLHGAAAVAAAVAAAAGAPQAHHGPARSWHAPATAAAPAAAPAEAGAAPAAAAGGWLVQVSVSQLLGLKGRYASERVVWLAGRLHVHDFDTAAAPGLAQVYERVKHGCCALHEAPTEACLLQT